MRSLVPLHTSTKYMFISPNLCAENCFGRKLVKNIFCGRLVGRFCEWVIRLLTNSPPVVSLYRMAELDRTVQKMELPPEIEEALAKIEAAKIDKKTDKRYKARPRLLHRVARSQRTDPLPFAHPSPPPRSSRATPNLNPLSALLCSLQPDTIQRYDLARSFDPRGAQAPAHSEHFFPPPPAAGFNVQPNPLYAPV